MSKDQSFTGSIEVGARNALTLEKGFGLVIDQNEVMDMKIRKLGDTMTAGIDALHIQDPSEILMRAEESANDESGCNAREFELIRCEIFSVFLEFLFSGGPEPEYVRDKIEALVVSFAPELIDGKSWGPTSWVDSAIVHEVLSKYRTRIPRCEPVALYHWVREITQEIDAERVSEIMRGIISHLLSEGRLWKKGVSVAYCLAIAYRPVLLGQMTMEDIAILSGDKGGRATPSARLMRLHTRRIQDAGAKAIKIHCQKSVSASESYSQAQRGNHNRAHKRKRR
jgi:hypothetical protein